MVSAFALGASAYRLFLVKVLDVGLEPRHVEAMLSAVAGS
jgi:hypothetical protein